MRAAESGHAGRGAPLRKTARKRPGGQFAYTVNYQCVAYTNYVFLHISARLRALRATCKLRAGGVSYLCIVRGKGGRREGFRARGILHDFTGRAERPQRGTAGAANPAGLNAQGAGDACSSRTRRRLTITILTIDFAVMARRTRRLVPLYVRIGKRKRKDSDAYILSVALRCGRKQGAFEGAVFFGRSPRRAMADINYDTVFWRKEIGGITHTLPAISPDAKYGKPGAETRCEFEKRRGQYYYGVILRDRRKELKMAQSELAENTE